MQIESLKIFCDVARLRSFSRGAEANNVLQSTASQAVLQLEERLGVALIDRSCRPWRLTREGEVFFEGSREVVARYFALEAQVKNIHGEIDSVVRVAAIYSVGLGDMSHLIAKFGERYAPARVQIEYLHPDRVYERVLRDEADLGIVSFPQTRRELTVIPWRQEPMVVVCPPQHRLARAKKIALTEVQGESFVGFDRELTIRKEVDRFLKSKGVSVNVVLEFDNIEGIKRAVEVASGISILPQPTLDHEVESGTLVAVPVATKQFARPLGIIHRRGKKLYASTDRFIELLRRGNNNGNGQREKP
jgi:DNA-binding transcriptional LysR family regulator